MEPPPPWVCLKFGGTSVATVGTWGAILRRVRELLPQRRVWLVVSALSGVTNALLRSLDEALAPGATRFTAHDWVVAAHATLARDMGLSDAEYAPVAALLDEYRRLLDGIVLTQEVSPRLRARVAALGELLSSQLGVAFLRRAGLRATRVDSRSLLTSEADDSGRAVSEADTYLEADVRPSVQPDRADAAAAGADVVIAQGFIAATPTGATCLLGRGGSDTSAALFAALIGAEHLEIWTDVNGVFSGDPRLLPCARLIRGLTYREAQELAAMGAKVLHPRCLLPAAHAGIPVEVRNTMDASADAELTVVSSTGTDFVALRGGAAAGGAGGHAAGPPGGGGGGGSGSDTPRFGALPPLRSPSPLSSSKIVYATHPPLAPPVAAASAPGGGSAGADASSAPPHSSRGSGSGGDGAAPPRVVVAAPSHPDVLATQPPKVLAVVSRKNVTLVTMAAFDMWGHAGFLTRAFAPFAAHAVSVDLIATSQYAISVTLDHIPDGVHGDTMRKVVAALSRTCSASVRYPCAVVSIVGRSLRNALPQLGAAMRVLEGVSVHMVSEASEDLNMSFVVDEEHADRLVQMLHRELLETRAVAADPQFGPTWAELPCGVARRAAAQ